MLTDEQEQLFRAKVSQLIADRDRAREAAKAHRAGEELLQQNINALAAEKDAAEAEVKRLRALDFGRSCAVSIVERAMRKGYDIGGAELAELAAVLGVDGGEGPC